MTLLKNFALAVLVGFAFSAGAQKKAPNPQFPASFMISAPELNAVLGSRPEQVLDLADNKYLDKAIVVKNVRNGDMQFVRMKLAFFGNAYLTVQVNGEYSTHVFIMSDNDAAFYKGTSKDGAVLMEQCSKDDIVVE